MSNLSIFEEENLTLLNSYSTYKGDLRVKCANGHITTTSLNKAALRVSRGTLICKECNSNLKLEKLTDKISNILKDMGYKLLSKEVSYDTKFTYICDKGHENTMAISNLMNNRKCPDCYGNKTTSTSTILKFLEEEGYSIASGYYPMGSKAPFDCRCPQGHIFTTTYDRFYNSNNRCPTCTSSTSRQEEEVYSFISSIYDGKIIRNDRSIIAPKELDIVLPELKLAIEYCGLYWHSELQGKDSSYHLNKLKLCEAAGYRLITLFEDEWVLNNIKCKSRLASYISTNNMVNIYARKCIIADISGGVAKAFCEENHIQNYGSGASIKIGAFYEGELVSVMTFSKPSLSKGRKTSSITSVEYELHRFCSKLNTTVIGAASKLLKYFERNYKCDALFTFADMRWSSANLYHKLGFEACDESAPCYYYFKDSLVRQHRFLYRKNVLKDKLDTFNPDLTEVQNMHANGFNRIFDCGNHKLVKKYK